MTKLMTERKRLRKGQAHIEYLAVKEEVDSLAAQGYDLKAIFNRLKESGKIKMSYQALHENRNRGKKKEKKAFGGRTESRPDPGRKPPAASHSKAERRRLFAQTAQARTTETDNFTKTNHEADPSEIDKLKDELI